MAHTCRAYVSYKKKDFAQNKKTMIEVDFTQPVCVLAIHSVLVFNCFVVWEVVLSFEKQVRIQSSVERSTTSYE